MHSPYIYTQSGTLILRDAPHDHDLRAYWTDLYHMFLRTYVKMSYEHEISEKDEELLRALLTEIISVKKEITKISA